MAGRRRAIDAALASTDAAAVTTAGATVVISGAGSTTAPPTAHGQNYWSWVTQYGDQVHQVEDGATAMHFTVLRAGGHNNDNNNPEAFDDAQVDAFIAYARATGAEPILQVPLLADGAGNRPTPQTAAAVVTYANVTKSYGIRYWEIGNEPDLYSDQGDLPAGYTAQSYCTDFAAFADAMRAADPSIRILGPELSYKYVPGNDWLTPFLMGCGTKVDVVSVHRYPFAAAACTVANAMGDAAQFRSTLRQLRSTMTSVGMGATPLAITEANFSYEGDPTLQTQPAALGTFYAGMWVADVAGVALEENPLDARFLEHRRRLRHRLLHERHLRAAPRRVRVRAADPTLRAHRAPRDGSPHRRLGLRQQRRRRQEDGRPSLEPHRVRRRSRRRLHGPLGLAPESDHRATALLGHPPRGPRRRHLGRPPLHARHGRPQGLPPQPE